MFFENTMLLTTPVDHEPSTLTLFLKHPVKNYTLFKKQS